MFTDMNVSEGLREKFNDFTKESAENTLDTDFSILVLSAGSWPISHANLINFSLPQELEKSVRLFETFYNKSYNGRKLTWMHYLCTTDIRLTYLKRPYSITMSIFQMAILLCFNSSKSLAIKEIHDTTQLPLKELVKQVQSLIDAKLILSETVNELTSELTEVSVIQLNLDYSNKRTKFKINSSIQKEAVQEAEVTQASVDEDRKLYLQATIVRIMKSRKSLNHNSLIQEVINQSKQRFTPSIGLIKKCIEALIDKLYIERTSTREEYKYIA